MRRHREAVRDIYAAVMQDPSQWTVWSPTFWEHASRVIPMDIASSRIYSILELMNPIAFGTGYYAAQPNAELLYALTVNDEETRKKFTAWRDRWLLASVGIDVSAYGEEEESVLMASRVYFPVYSPRNSVHWADAVAEVNIGIRNRTADQEDLVRRVNVYGINNNNNDGPATTLAATSIVYQNVPDRPDRGHVGRAGLIRFDLSSAEGGTSVLPAASVNIVQLGRVIREKTLIIPK